MSAVDFYLYGAENDALQQFDGKNNVPATACLQPSLEAAAVAQEVAKDLNVRIQQIREGCMVVDGLVEVSERPAQERGEAQDFWAANRNLAILFGSLGFAALAGGIACLSFATSVAAIVAGAVSTFAMPFFVVFNFYRAYEAQAQLHQWSVDFGAVVAGMRAAAYTHGFFYALNHQMHTVFQGGVLHSDEIRYLYGQALNGQKAEFERVQPLSVAEKNQALQAFVSGMLFGKQALEFAYHDQDFGVVVHAYTAFCKNVASIDEYLVHMKGKVEEAYQQYLKALSAERENCTLPFKQVRDEWQRSIDKQYGAEVQKMRSSLQDLPDVDNDRVREARGQLQNLLDRKQTEWVNESRNLEVMYQKATAHVHNWHRHEKLRLDGWKKEEVQKIEAQRDQYIVPCFNEACRLFDSLSARLLQGGQMKDVLVEPIEFIELGTFVPEAMQAPTEQQGQDRRYGEFLAAVMDA
jgi:hypothetical protein